MDELYRSCAFLNAICKYCRSVMQHNYRFTKKCSIMVVQNKSAVFKQNADISVLHLHKLIHNEPYK